MTLRTSVVTRRGLAVAVVSLVAACGSPDETDGADRSRSGPLPTVPVVQVEESPEESVPSALDAIVQPGLPGPLIDQRDLQPGGPPPDGIPPIDEPVFHRAGDVDFLSDDEPVLALEIDDEARAYPVQVMIWHEIVNDTFGDRPVTVTYCPLCNTAIAVDRRVGDRVLSFGTSGMLYNSALVMYDRQTRSLWSHFTGQAVAGVLTGTELKGIPIQTLAWGDWLEANPDGLVLSRETGVDRDYGRNPYPGYDDIDEAPFLFDGEVDGRLAAKERVVGFGLDTEPTAVRLEPLLDDGVVPAEVAGRPVTVWAVRGTSSALEGNSVDDGRDVGSTGVFRAEHEGRELTFRRDGETFVDTETGSRWDISGQAVDGPLTGAQLEALEHVDTFWFAWGAFSPDTVLLPSGA
jgi:hypothetical protein